MTSVFEGWLAAFPLLLSWSDDRFCFELRNRNGFDVGNGSNAANPDAFAKNLSSICESGHFCEGLNRKNEIVWVMQDEQIVGDQAFWLSKENHPIRHALAFGPLPPFRFAKVSGFADELFVFRKSVQICSCIPQILRKRPNDLSFMFLDAQLHPADPAKASE